MNSNSLVSFGKQVIDYHINLNANWKLPQGVDLLYPFDDENTKLVFSKFYFKYFDDNHTRHFLFGINPGRFGAGVTGIPFTDPKILEERCEIPNSFRKKNELSAIFVYDFINNLGGLEAFYSKFYITSVCPLGFVKDGKNYNYYDDKILYKAVEEKIVENINVQKSFGCNEDTAFCMGNGKNFKFFNILNEKHHFFHRIIPLPHPRWVMQYRLKSKMEYVYKYVEEISSVL
ncbi:MAG: uracil-DNA glycosylase family protein [Saprospiraceae bacterium]